MIGQHNEKHDERPIPTRTNSQPPPRAIPAGFNPAITSPIWLTRRLLLNGVAQYAGRFSGSLLDFGCGAKPYQSLFKVEKYVGVDFEGEGHDHRNEQIDFVYDGKKLPFENASFDGVLSTEVLEHIFNLPEVLQEMHRVLRPGGLILITCPFAICEHEQPNDFARYTSFAIRHLLEQHGFEVMEQQKLGTAQEALWQMRIVYWNWYVLSKVNNVRVLRTLLRHGFNVTANTLAWLCNQLLPSANDLYLNNLVLAKRK
jgi:SAM-dependent methyltransferase